jgi:hypothetical protein
MNKTTFKIAKMDCSAEEQLVGMSLADMPDIKELSFDRPCLRRMRPTFAFLPEGLRTFLGLLTKRQT